MGTWTIVMNYNFLKASIILKDVSWCRPGDFQMM